MTVERLGRELQIGARFVLSGGLGLVLGAAMYEFVYWVNPTTTYRATSSYVTSYLVGIVLQHALHRWIVFGDEVPYLRSLRRTFVVYPAVLLLASAANLVMVNGLGWNHRIAFWATVIGSGVLSFVGLRLFAFNAGYRAGHTDS